MGAIEWDDEGSLTIDGKFDDELLNEYMLLDRDDFMFQLDKSAVQPGRTFSEEALQSIRAQLFLWMGGRMYAYWKRTGRPPIGMQLYAEVRFRGGDPNGSAVAEDA